MSNLIRAWKDEAYRQNLSIEEQTMLPADPVGTIELTEAELEAISGTGSESGSSRRFVFDFDKDESETQQIVTYQPMIATLVIFAPTAPMCNNTASPASSRADQQSD